MNGPHAKTLLVVLVGVVPLLVAGAGVASFLLLRAGYGLLVGGLVPFAALIVVVVAVAVALGRAGGTEKNRDESRRGR